MKVLNNGFRFIAWIGITLGLGSAGDLSGGNPLIKDIGMSDPHVRVFDGKIYRNRSRPSALNGYSSS